MDMDIDISRWVLEFLVRKGVGDNLITQVLSTLPLPENSSSRWKKTVLLRTIDSETLDGSVSEKILDLLEMIAEVDRRDGYVVFETMRSAYCAVAVDCTVRYMEEKSNGVGKYFDAVERIWRGRIGNLEKSESVDLISDQLRSWMDEIEAAVWDDKVCKKSLRRNTRNEALKAVRDYVTEAWKVMGPSFLELAAKKMGKSLMESQKLGKHSNFDQLGERPTSLPDVSVGVCNEFNKRDEDRARDECANEDGTQVGDRGRTCIGDIGDCTKHAAVTVNQVEQIAILLPNEGAAAGDTEQPTKRDTCQVKGRISSKSNYRYELSASTMPCRKDNDQCEDEASSVHQDLGGSAKLANTDEIHVEEIAIRLHDVNGDSTDVQAKGNKFQIQDKASTSFDATRDLAIADRPPIKDKRQSRVAATTCPRHLGGSTGPAIRDENISLPNGGADFGVRDTLIKGEKYQLEESATTLSIAGQEGGVREKSIMKYKDQSGERAATYSQDRDGSTESARTVENQAEKIAMPLKLSVTDEFTVRDNGQDEERVAMTLSDHALRAKEVENGNVLAKRKHVAGRGKCTRRGIKIADVEDYAIETSGNKFDCLPSPEVNKVQAALRSSSLELRAVVKDPLPEAISLAEAVISDMGSKDMNHELSVETHDRMDVDIPSHSVDASVEAVQADEINVLNLSSMHQNDDLRPSLIEETQNRIDANASNSFVNIRSGAVQGSADNPGNQCSSHQNNEPRPSLMAQNGTARIYEWDDSIDGSSERPSSSKRLHLTSPKRIAVSPLKKYEPAKVARRRVKWSNVEEDTLRTGVQKFGRGNWKVILNSYRDIFEDRTEIDLKDKWRNLMK